MAKIKVTKQKSAINRTKRQKLTLLALGLKKIGQTIEHDATPNILGMVNKVKHLVSVEEMNQIAVNSIYKVKQFIRSDLKKNRNKQIKQNNKIQ